MYLLLASYTEGHLQLRSSLSFYSVCCALPRQGRNTFSPGQGKILQSRPTTICGFSPYDSPVLIEGGRWDDFDSEASQSFKASSDDSGDFCKPRKRQAVNYAESSDESEKEKAEKPSRRRKVIESDEEVALEDSDSDEEQDDDDELSDEDASNDESDSDDSDSDDSDEEDSDGNVTRRKKGKSKKRAEKGKWCGASLA